ncbi:hypothetical protein [Kitasatospora sp. NPDC050543]|uniref:hypothetical protein n=1 Tax=Kitasatospora sp. NPDC050543 TaxID=3364054 RepID=UPI003798F7B9
MQATGIDVTGSAPVGVSVCKGDTGGPAVRESGGHAELVAVSSTSWQNGCLGSTETAHNGARSTRVDDLAGWVQEVRYRTVEVKPGTHLFAIGAEGSSLAVVWSGRLCLGVAGAQVRGGAGQAATDVDQVGDGVEQLLGTLDGADASNVAYSSAVQG